MKAKLVVQTTSLKSFLQLFDKSEILENFELFDMEYKESSLIDETVFQGNNTVENILSLDSDFKGYIIFKAEINNLTIELVADHPIQKYHLSGEDFQLRLLMNKMIELNCYQQDRYMFSEISPFYNS